MSCMYREGEKVPTCIAVRFGCVTERGRGCWVVGSRGMYEEKSSWTSFF